jgi:hypothetical protein
MPKPKEQKQREAQLRQAQHDLATLDRNRARKRDLERDLAGNPPPPIQNQLQAALRDANRRIQRGERATASLEP